MAFERRADGLEMTSEISPEAWDSFVRDQIGANLYHFWGWRRVFEDAFGHETLYLAARRDGTIAGILPLVIFRSRVFGRFAVSLPFVDGGGVCTRDPWIADRLVEAAKAVAAERRLSHVELRHITRQFPDLPVRQHKVGMRLALEGDATRTWNALDRKVRNQVRKAEKSGLVTTSGGIELLDRFYTVFARNMRDLGTPVYPIRFFQRVLSLLDGTARVFLVGQEDTTVAAGIALVDRGSLAVPWASSLRESRALCPNNLLYWRIIEHAIASGLSVLDFGRSTPGEGTHQFKAQWGAQPTPLYWEYALTGRDSLPDVDRANPRFRAAIAAWKRLPLPVTHWLGPRIVRSFP